MGGARVLHQDQVVPVEILMIQAAGPVNIVLFQMSSWLPYARCASGDRKQIEPRGCGDVCFCFLLAVLRGGISWRRVFPKGHLSQEL